MTIAHDAASSPTAGTGNLSWTHTPTGTPRGVLVLVSQSATHSAFNFVSGVTYGGVAMTFLGRISGPTGGGEQGALYAYFLGVGVPVGAQTVVVSVTGAVDRQARAYSMTAADDVVASPSTFTNESTGATAALLSFAAATSSQFYAAIGYGLDATTTIAAGANWTGLTTRDHGTWSGAFVRRSALSTGASNESVSTWTGSEEFIILGVGLHEAVESAVGVSFTALWDTHAVLPDPLYPTQTDLQEAAYAAILADTTQRVHRVDIYESDGETPYLLDAPFSAYDVNAKAEGSLHRTLDLTLYNLDGSLRPRAGGFWYDKVVKVFAGVHLDAFDRDYFVQVGEFEIADIDTASFPRGVVGVSGNDHMEALGKAKFGEPTTYTADTPIETVVRAIAALGGVTKLRISAVGKTLEEDFPNEPDTTLVSALESVAGAYGCEVFFDGAGWLVFRELEDTDTAAAVLTYEPGERGSLANIEWKATRARLYNEVVVSGESTAQDTPPVFARAENTNPTSPTRIRVPGEPGGLPRTTLRYVSPLLTTEAQCAETAQKMLQRAALEDFEADAEVLVVPWLEEGRIVIIVDPDPPEGEEARQRWLVTGFSLSSAPGSHKVAAKRVVSVS